ncbi:MAG: hypothetical protein HFI06_10735 [Eubacterium sp.]|jgi:uncharacterized membrane protein YkoI|nr:hypothetical protein [Eubacterium sp.]NBI86413.1 hypothetical protein [Lachnospiraceae bacterium]
MKPYKTNYTASSILLLTAFLLTGCAQQNPPADSPPPNPENTPAPETEAASAPPTKPDAPLNTEAAANTGIAPDSTPPTPEPQTPDTSASNPAEAAESAKSAALSHAGLTDSVIFLKVEQENDHGQATYEIEFTPGTTKYEYEISAADNSVLKFSQEPLDTALSNLWSYDLITAEDAKTAALKKAGLDAGQASCIKWELDYDYNMPQYDIEYYINGIEYEFTVDAVSGDVLKMDTD